MEIYQGNTTVALVFNLVLAVDHITPATGKVPTVFLSKNGYPFAAPAGAVTEIGNGAYQVAPNATDADTLGSLLLYATATACDPVTKEWTVVAVPAPPPTPTPGVSMTVTALDIITLALQTLGKVGLGEPVGGEMAAQAFTVMSEMLDNWKTQRLLVPQLVRAELPLTAGKTSYTVGVGGDLDVQRPWGIRYALMQDGVFERRVPIYDEEAHAQRSYKVFPGAIITEVYYDQTTHPLATLHVPRDLGTGTLVLYLLTGLPQFSSLSESYVLLPGYAAAIRYQLVLQLAPIYGMQVSNFIYGEATRTMADVKRQNQRFRLLSNYFSQEAQYNIYTDEYQ